MKTLKYVSVFVVSVIVLIIIFVFVKFTGSYFDYDTDYVYHENSSKKLILKVAKQK